MGHCSGRCQEYASLLRLASRTPPPLAASVLARLLLLWALGTALLFAQAGVIARARAYTATRIKWLARQHPPHSTVPVQSQALAIVFLILNLAFSAVQFDAYVLEPLWVQTTDLTLSFDQLDPNAPPVRVVHLTDLHIERNSYREATIIRKVNALQPDLIVFTGDYLNLSRLHDPVSAAHWRQFVSQLEAPYGIYAVRGTVEPSLESMAWLVEGTDITWLEQETKTLDVRGQKVTLIGVACSHDLELDTARLDLALKGAPEAPPGTFRLLLYHSPDMIREAARARCRPLPERPHAWRTAPPALSRSHRHRIEVRSPIRGRPVQSAVRPCRIGAAQRYLDVQQPRPGP